jgi:hypothetical protein
MVELTMKALMLLIYAFSQGNGPTWLVLGLTINVDTAIYRLSSRSTDFDVDPTRESKTTSMLGRTEDAVSESGDTYGYIWFRMLSPEKCNCPATLTTARSPPKQ